MLVLPIKKKWFDMILSGEKKEEYREIKPYYKSRFFSLFDMVDECDGQLINPFEENPELPVIPCVDSEIVADSGYNWWLGSWGNAHIEIFLNTQEYGMLYKDDIEDVFEKFFDYEECEITNDMTDDEVQKIMREYVDKLPWQTAILVNIDLPNAPILKNNKYGRLGRDVE